MWTWEQLSQHPLIPLALHAGGKILMALALWLIGRWLINNVAIKLLSRALNVRKFDATLTRYAVSIVHITLNIVLVIGILGYFGIETTSFAAIIAAAGVAIGMAWSGLLANFAAGVFIIILRPFKTGDFICAGGVTGTVTQIGLFTTTLNTPDHVQTIVGNNKIFADNIQNFSHNPYRRVELKAQLSGSTDPIQAAALLKAAVAQIPHVLVDPAVEVDILEFNLLGAVLAVRPFAHNDHYWQVFFDTNRVIRETLLNAGFAAPMPAQTVIVQQP
jgi:small conductance mechanosensitive channel